MSSKINAELESVWTSAQLVEMAKVCGLAHGQRHIPEPVPDFEIGTYAEQIENQFDITGLKYLNQGSFGSVFVGTQAQSGTKYSVKVLSTTFTILISMLTFCKKAKNEINLMQTLKHANIVKYFDCFKVYDDILNLPIHVLIKMEHLDQTLEHAISIRTFDEAQCMRLLRQIGGALSYMHEQGVAHHDIKPSNIMITTFDASTDANSYTYKLIDFGLAKTYKLPMDRAEEYGRIGTALYMCPEKIFGKDYNPFRSDSYSFGVTLTSALIGPDVIEKLWIQYVRIISVASIKRLVKSKRMTKILSCLMDYSQSKRSFIKEVMKLDTGNRICNIS